MAYSVCPLPFRVHTRTTKRAPVLPWAGKRREQPCHGRSREPSSQAGSGVTSPSTTVPGAPACHTCCSEASGQPSVCFPVTLGVPLGRRVCNG